MTDHPLAPGFLNVPLAHRGLHDAAAGRLENSLSAIDAAIEAGYGIEIDVQPSRDGVPMVFHDYVLDRLTGETGPVSAHSAEELEAITLTGSTDTIPRLSTVLAHVAGRVPLLIEIKDQDGALGPDVGPLQREVADVIEDYEGPVAVMSFNPHTIAAFGEAAPEIPRGLVTQHFREEDWPDVPEPRRTALSELAGFGASGAGFVSCGRRDLDRPQIRALRSRGVPVLTWTIRSPEQEAEARAFADNITFEGYLPARD